MVRTIAERLARGRVLRRRLPNGRAIFISPDAQLKYLRSEFDEDLIALAKERVGPGDVVWDVGANCGVFAFSCDKAAAVLCVEADPFLADVLRRSARLSANPVDVLCCAVSNECGLASLSIAARGRASNHLSSVSGSTQTGGERHRLTVPTLTLDTLLAAHQAPSFVKIDVEGAEMMVLQGARQLLAEARPTLWLEATGPLVEACRAFLGEFDYEMTRASGENFLCLPKENTDRGEDAEPSYR